MLRQRIEAVTGPLNDDHFKSVLFCTTSKIKEINLAFGIRTTMEDAAIMAVLCCMRG